MNLSKKPTLSRTFSRIIFQFCGQIELDFGSGQGSGQGFDFLEWTHYSKFLFFSKKKSRRCLHQGAPMPGLPA
jgi:hypothetical protein